MFNKYLSCNCKINTFEQLESTNITAKEFAQNGAAEGTVIIAKNQTAGKGRLARKFHSPNGGLYMSVILRPSVTVVDTTLITAAAAVAVCNAIEKATGICTGIKWVNDVFLNGKKVCGILTVGSILPETAKFDYAILGIGLNINPPKDGLPDEIKNIATTLFDTKCDDEKFAQITAEILNEFFNIYKTLPSREFLKQYRERSIIIGTEVICADANHEEPVFVENIDDNANLIVKTKQGIERTLNSGEVRIKI